MKPFTVMTLQADGTLLTVSPRTSAVHVERFTPDIVADRGALANALTRLQKALTDAEILAARNPFGNSILVRGLSCGGAGAKLVVPHALGRFAQWLVVGWRGAGVISAPALIEDTLDASPQTSTTQIAFRSYSSGTADILLF